MGENAMASPLLVGSLLGDERSPDPPLVAEYRASRHRRANALPSTAARTIVINDGRDTLIMFGDGSTILVKGVADIDETFCA
jgi:hypothetical protein